MASSIPVHLLANPIQAVLLDFDGVIADTMEENFRAWDRVLSSVGIKITKHDYFLNEGRKASEIVAELARVHKKQNIDFQKLAQAKDDYYNSHNSLKLYPGVEQLVDFLHDRNILVGLVSGAMALRLKHPLIDDFRKKLDVVVSGDDCKMGKPAPEPYLLGSKRLGIMPIHCLVVENAPLGIQAAKAAGMRTIGVTSTLKPEYLKDADMIVSSILELNSLSSSLFTHP